MSIEFCKIIDGVIIESGKRLPFMEDGVCFGVGVTEKEMTRFGYLPVIDEAPVLDEYTRQTGVEYVVKDGFVEKVYNVVTLTEDEVVAEKTPSSITQRQCRLQLVNIGAYQNVLSAIGSMSDTAQIEWEYASEIKKDNPLVGAMQQLLGKTDREMNEFFIEASKL